MQKSWPPGQMGGGSLQEHLPPSYSLSPYQQVQRLTWASSKHVSSRTVGPYPAKQAPSSLCLNFCSCVLPDQFLLLYMEDLFEHYLPHLYGFSPFSIILVRTKALLQEHIPLPFQLYLLLYLGKSSCARGSHGWLLVTEFRYFVTSAVLYLMSHILMSGTFVNFLISQIPVLLKQGKRGMG